MKECRFYQKVDREGEYASNTVRCQLCPHCCVILEGKHGKCGSRWNFNGMLYSVVYGKPCALADDPVEKKLYLVDEVIEYLTDIRRKLQEEVK